MSMFTEGLEQTIWDLQAEIKQLKEKLDSWKCFFDDCNKDVEALVYLSEELTRLGYRDLDPSSCKAAIKAIEQLTKELKDARQA